MIEIKPGDEVYDATNNNFGRISSVKPDGALIIWKIASLEREDIEFCIRRDVINYRAAFLAAQDFARVTQQLAESLAAKQPETVWVAVSPGFDIFAFSSHEYALSFEADFGTDLAIQECEIDESVGLMNEYPGPRRLCIDRTGLR